MGVVTEYGPTPPGWTASDWIRYNEYRDEAERLAGEARDAGRRARVWLRWTHRLAGFFEGFSFTTKPAVAIGEWLGWVPSGTTNTLFDPRSMNYSQGKIAGMVSGVALAGLANAGQSMFSAGSTKVFAVKFAGTNVPLRLVTDAGANTAFREAALGVARYLVVNGVVGNVAIIVTEHHMADSFQPSWITADELRRVEGR